MDISDRAVVTSLLEGQGPMIDHDRWLKLQTKLNPDGRVVELTLGTGRSNLILNGRSRDITQYWSLDGALIVKLDKLKKLQIIYCQSLALEALAQLPHLECLELFSCYGMALADSVACDVITSPPTVLSNLVELTINSGIWDDTSMRVWMKWVVNSLPILKVFRLVLLPKQPPHPEPGDLRNDRDDVINNVGTIGGHLVDAVIDVLLSVGHKSSFQRSLKKIVWWRCRLTNAVLQRMFLEMLPHYPNLSTIFVHCNKISSLQFLLPTDGELCPSLLSTSLRTLHLYCNPIMKMLANNQTKSEPERRALMRLLDDLCPFLGSLPGPEETWDAAIEGRLNVNRSGGRILFRQNENNVMGVKDESRTGTNDGIDPANASKVVPDGLWPILLEQAYATNAKPYGEKLYNATGVYYLLRNHFFYNQ